MLPGIASTLQPGQGTGFFQSAPPVGTGVDPVFLIQVGATNFAVLDRQSNEIEVFAAVGDQLEKIQTIGSGGADPVDAAEGDLLDNGQTELVVADNGNGNFGLFLDEAGQLVFTRDVSNPAAVNPAAVALSTLTSNGTFYATTDGANKVIPIQITAADLVPLVPTSVVAPSSGPSSEVVVLQPLEGSENLALVATLLTGGPVEPPVEMTTFSSQGAFEGGSTGSDNPDEAVERLHVLQSASAAVRERLTPLFTATTEQVAARVKELGAWFAEGMFNHDAEPDSPLQLVRLPVAATRHLVQGVNAPRLAWKLGQGLLEAGRLIVFPPHRPVDGPVVPPGMSALPGANTSGSNDALGWTEWGAAWNAAVSGPLVEGDRDEVFTTRLVETTLAIGLWQGWAARRRKTGSVTFPAVPRPS
jgi:VCBS repeat-containing protein